MPYTATQLRAMYSSVHAGLAPDQTSGAAIELMGSESQTGIRTDAALKTMLVNGADNDTAVAGLSYQFFTGAVPSAAGLAYLVNSTLNQTDLNDPYYRAFNLENRYINFAANLGLVGEGAVAFAAAYAGLSFAQAVDAAYEKIIGSALATAAGINVVAAKADIAARADYFTALAGQSYASGSQIDLAAKAGVVGYIMAEAMKADIGAYAAAMNRYSLTLMDGTAAYGQDLMAANPVVPPVAPVAPPAVLPVIVPVVPPVVPPVIPPVVPSVDPMATPASPAGATITDVGAAAATFVGGPGDNTVTSGAGAATITTGAGNDIIVTGAGADTIVAGDGTNFVNAGDGANTITTGSGNDNIIGGVAVDTIVAGDGDNFVYTGAGADTVTTGIGDDLIVMGANLTTADTVTAGAGADILRVSGLLTGVAFTLVTGVETLDLAGASSVTLGAQGMTAGIVAVTNSGDGGVSLDASAYTTPITVTMGAGDDVVIGGAGPDVLDGGAGLDSLDGGAGLDRFIFSTVDADTDVVLTAATDIVAGGFVSGADRLDFTIAATGAGFQKLLAPAATLAAFSAAADAALNGVVQYYFGVVGLDGYLAADTDGTGITAIIKLTGVADMAFGDII